MMELTKEVFAELIDEVRLAPSVHNVQPARWRYDQGRVQLMGDPASAIPVADPDGRDWRLSLGAHFEGLAIAASGRGLVVHDVKMDRGDAVTDMAPLIKISDMTMRPVTSDDGDLVMEPVKARASWRGAFKPRSADAVRAIEQLRSERSDCVFIDNKKDIGTTATLADRAALHFLRDNAHRKELCDWLRLSTKHPRYHLDGLNAEAMSLSAIEGWGAGLVLGSLFQPLDKVGLAAPLVNEASKTRTAAAIVLFHRPAGEDAFQSGRAFYRVWLAMERAGLAGCPMSVLADWPRARDALARDFSIPEDRRIVSVFRIGHPRRRRRWSHARLPVNQIIV